MSSSAPDNEEERPSLRPQSMASRVAAAAAASSSSSASALRPQSSLRPGGSSQPPAAARTASPSRDEDDEDGDNASASVSASGATADADADDSKQTEDRDDPLETDWVFWFDKRLDQGGRSGMLEAQFASNLKIVGEFDTVQGFWRFYNNMRLPSDIEINANYHLFKSGIKPMWEDPVNAGGGKWVIQSKGKDKVPVDALWLNLILAMIGENLDDTRDEVCGAVMSRRQRGDKISVWNKTNDPAVIMKLGQSIKRVVSEGVSVSGLSFGYNLHNESLTTGTSYTKALYTL